MFLIISMVRSYKPKVVLSRAVMFSECSWVSVGHYNPLYTGRRVLFPEITESNPPHVAEIYFLWIEW